jgi:hypothetical protein
MTHADTAIKDSRNFYNIKLRGVNEFVNILAKKLGQKFYNQNICM